VLIMQQCPDRFLEDEFVVIVKALADQHRDKLELLKRKNCWQQDDGLWEELLSSLATMGNSKGFVLVENEEYHAPVRWSALLPLQGEQRHTVIEQSLKSAGVRWPEKKAKWLDLNFQFILDGKGPCELRAQLESRPGGDAKIEFLRQFRGIGPKYARNMMMDAFHPDFRDSIAIDSRIKKVTAALGQAFTSYTEEEAYYRGLAKRAGLMAWELDRLMYWCNDEVLDALESARPDNSATNQFASASGSPTRPHNDDCKLKRNHGDLSHALRVALAATSQARLVLLEECRRSGGPRGPASGQQRPDQSPLCRRHARRCHHGHC
jgi:hypothetical protein